MLYEKGAETQAVSIQYITERQHPRSTAVALEVTWNIGLFYVRSKFLIIRTGRLFEFMCMMRSTIN